jgi:hypothetical protein
MLVYHYDAATGEYLGTTMAQESPLETGVFLVPAYATVTAPPEATTGYACVWDGSAWGQAQDHRDEQGYVDGVAATVTKLGALPDGWSASAPESTEAELATRVRTQRDFKLTACEWLVIRHRDQSDAGATTTLTAAEYLELLTYRQVLRDITAQEGWPGSITWPTVPDFVEET